MELKTVSVILDNLMNILTGSSAFYDYIGSLTCVNVLSQVYEEDRVLLMELLQKAIDTDREQMCAFRLLTADTNYHWVLGRVRTEKKPDGKHTIYLDIQDVENLEKQIQEGRQQSALSNRYLEIVGEILFLYRRESDYFRIFSGGSHMIVFYEGSFEKWLDEQEIGGEDRGLLLQYMNRCISGFEQKISIQKLAAGWSSGDYLIRGRRVDSEGDLVIGHFRQVSGEGVKDQEMSCTIASEIDSMLDILNKKAITEYAKNAIARGEHLPINICVVDIDNFKRVNDVMGHLAGDEVLVMIAAIIKDVIRGHGVAGRVGGDELLVVLDHGDDYLNVKGILRNIRSRVEQAFLGKYEGISVTCSIGAAAYPDYANDYETLFAIADKMLYRAKEKGKNRYIIYDPKLHGSIGTDGQENLETGVKSFSEKEKEELSLRLMESFLCRRDVTLADAFEQVGVLYSLDEIDLFFGEGLPLLQMWTRSEEGDDRGCSIAYMSEKNISSVYEDNGMSVIDSVAYLEHSCPVSFEYFSEHGVRAALIYRMQNGEGYITFYKENPNARKWSAGDIKDLTYLSRVIELSLEEK